MGRWPQRFTVVEVPEGVKRAGALSDYAVESHYPGLAEPVIQEEYEEAVVIAEVVVRRVDEIVGVRPNLSLDAFES